MGDTKGKNAVIIEDNIYVFWIYYMNCTKSLACKII